MSKELYTNLKELANNEDLGFTLTEQEWRGHKIHIFSYRLCSYSDFCLPSALESRGVAFLVDDKNNPTILSRPFEKFFNWKENPFTENIDFSNPIEVADKADGSMISSLIIDDELLLKSKTSLFSDMAIDSLNWLKINKDFYQEVYNLDKAGYTVIMEWCAPFNRIVLQYDKPALIVLAVRHRETGKYLTKQDIENNYPVIARNWTKQYNPDEVNPETIKHMENIEGFVYWLNNGQRVKIKTEWYLVRHRMKDTITNPKALFEAVLEEATDDIRTLWHDDEDAIKTIEEMENKVISFYNHFVNHTEKFYNENKNMSRKDYAIKAKSELSSMEFTVAMMLYSGKKVDYKGIMMKNYKDILENHIE